MSERTQDYREIAIYTEEEKDSLLFRRATIVDHIGRPFHMEVDVISENGDYDFSKIVGRNATIRINQKEGTPRFFNGMITKFIHAGGTAKTAHYRMTLSPWLWFLTRMSDCRIFQDKT